MRQYDTAQADLYGVGRGQTSGASMAPPTRRRFGRGHTIGSPPPGRSSAQPRAVLSPQLQGPQAVQSASGCCLAPSKSQQIY
eukprot:4517909-Prymnesium_polylepis.1